MCLSIFPFIVDPSPILSWTPDPTRPSGNMVRTVQLSDGTSMPAMAWGNMGGSEKALQAGTVALKCGIHHIDTAQIYYTEAQVLGAIKGAGLQRDQVYVTTKCAHESPSMTIAC